MTQIIYLFIMLIGGIEMIILDKWWIGLAALLVGGFLLIATEIQEKEL